MKEELIKLYKEFKEWENKENPLGGLMNFGFGGMDEFGRFIKWLETN